MDCYVIEGGVPLKGEINLQGAKNSALPVLAASLLNRGICEIENCPDIKDTETSIEILRSLGCKVTKEKNKVVIDSSCCRKYIIKDSLMNKMRSSIVFLGSLLATSRQAVVSYPGGCCLGERPVDIHIKAFKDMGGAVYEIYGSLYCLFDKAKESEIYLKYPSVGATENAVIASVFTQGKTVINNVAREPEILHLQEFLNSMGAKVEGAGSDRITVEGVKELKKYVKYKIPSDRIALVTYLTMGAATGGNIKINNATCFGTENEIKVFQKMGYKISVTENAVEIDGSIVPKAFGRISTSPYPGFPTDSQPFMCMLGALADGESIIEENVFENRFEYARELEKFNFNIRQEENKLIINKSNLKNAECFACDLRGGAVLCIASLCAKGISKIYDIGHIDRGYEDFQENILKLGGRIKRVYEEEKSVERIG